MSARAKTLLACAGIGSLALLASCSDPAGSVTGASSFRVRVTAINGSTDLPTKDAPLPANRGDIAETWTFELQAISGDGNEIPFDGFVRVDTKPGAVLKVEGEGASGRNILVKDGKAQGTVTVTAVYGPSRLWIEDLGYVPAPPDKEKPACSNGVNDDGDEDIFIDFPADPGCAFADDDTEEGGTFAAGVSAPLQYALPTLSDIQGLGSTTPYPYESIEVNTQDPQYLVVTRVASDGFYVTDVNPSEKSKGYNHLFAFNFSTPPGMRVCDRVTYLSGTLSEFFGFTELSFPSYDLSFPVDGKDKCLVPEPTVLIPSLITDPGAMEKLESSLVRIEGYHVTKNFGPKPAKNNVFGPDQSSCDINGDGRLDFTDPLESSCTDVCSADPECSEWTGFLSRGNYKASNGSSMIQINTSTAPNFDPIANRGTTFDALTGTLRNFSGGTLNWTIETRCPDDLACSREGCVPAPLSSDKACVRLRTINDNDQAN